MTDITAEATAFRAARDHLLTHRDQQAKTGASFRWPLLREFNWALDHFDRLAREDGDALALWVVDEGAGEQKVSYARMAARSNQVANRLRGLGVARGDRVLLMLGNEVPLWETMLARLQQAVIDNANVFEVLMDAVRVCSLGQITGALFEVGGQYRRSM